MSWGTGMIPISACVLRAVEPVVFYYSLLVLVRLALCLQPGTRVEYDYIPCWSRDCAMLEQGQ
jgi:hypothetical protein